MRLALYVPLLLAAGCASSSPVAKSEPAASSCDALEIAMAPQLPRRGTYAMTVRTDAGTSTCRVVFPAAPCGTPAPTCAGTLPLQVVPSDCKLPPEKQSFPKLRLASLPSKVVVDGRWEGTKSWDWAGKYAVGAFIPVVETTHVGVAVCRLGRIAGTWREDGEDWVEP